jgi:hypothetical protein
MKTNHHVDSHRRSHPEREGEREGQINRRTGPHLALIAVSDAKDFPVFALFQERSEASTILFLGEVERIITIGHAHNRLQ